MDTRDERLVSVHEMTRGTQNIWSISDSFKTLISLRPLGVLGPLNPVSP